MATLHRVACTIGVPVASKTNFPNYNEIYTDGSSRIFLDMGDILWTTL